MRLLLICKSIFQHAVVFGLTYLRFDLTVNGPTT